jgi:NifU-like protein involved in Fe-S cluster formation
MDHYAKPRNVGSLDKSKTSVGTGIVGAPACGDVMKLQIEVDEKTGVIREAKFRVLINFCNFLDFWMWICNSKF